MSDIISRQGAINTLIRESHADGAYGYLDAKSINDALERMPSAQPDIIYCKDCKHWMPYDWMFSEVWRSVSMDDYSDDEIGCAYCDMNMHANDFCSRAERKNDE